MSRLVRLVRHSRSLPSIRSTAATFLRQRILSPSVRPTVCASHPRSLGLLLQRHLATMASYTVQPPSANPLHVWSILPPHHPLPLASSVRAIHVYDFDNTLFLSPLPNPKIWHGPTLNNLQAATWLSNGGWWHDSRILAATGSGVEVEEKRAWEGWWNESIVQLVKLSMEQKDVMTILLTGRSVEGFGQLIMRMVMSKGLQFDMVVLKPEMKNTLDYKRDFLKELLNHYDQAEEIKIYEDRIKHVRSFEDFLTEYMASTHGRRAPLTTASVVEVSEESRCLPPSIELAEVQTMINEHNNLRPAHTPPLRIKKTVFYTGYLLPHKGTAYVLNALNIPQQVAQEPEVKLLGNSVLITPKPATKDVLKRTGDMGTKIEFEVDKVGNWEGRVWAAIVKPVDPKVRIYTENPRPLLVLAVRRNTKPIDASRIHAWNAPPKPNIRFTSVVGERLLFRIEEDFPNEGEFDSLFPRRRQRPDVSTASAAVANRDGRFSQGDRDSEFSSNRDSRRPSAAIGNAPSAPVPAPPPPPPPPSAGYGYGYGGPGGPGNGNGNAGGWRFDAYPGRNDVFRYEDPDRPDQPPFGYQTKPMW